VVLVNANTETTPKGNKTHKDKDQSRKTKEAPIQEAISA
jgi:hypothetical protein